MFKYIEHNMFTRHNHLWAIQEDFTWINDRDHSSQKIHIGFVGGVAYMYQWYSMFGLFSYQTGYFQDLMWVNYTSPSEHLGLHIP